MEILLIIVSIIFVKSAVSAYKFASYDCPANCKLGCIRYYNSSAESYRQFCEGKLCSSKGLKERGVENNDGFEVSFKNNCKKIIIF